MKILVTSVSDLCECVMSAGAFRDMTQLYVLQGVFVINWNKIMSLS